jgi:predicted MPP superfamily phosphohydrolase
LVAAVLIGLAVWAVVIERQLFVIREQTLKVLPAGSKPIRVLQIGDIHLAPWQKKKMGFLSSLGSKDIDLVVNTGDNLGHKDAIKPLLDALGPLLAKPGVFVHGSNDYFAPVAKNPFGYIFHTSKKPRSSSLNTQELTQGFESAGWVNLNNRFLDIDVNGSRIRFLGIDDYHIGYSKFELLVQSNRFSIALTHAPYLEAIEKLTSLGAELIFAGHTHGGQVRLPLIGALTTNSDLPNRFARGISAWEIDGKRSVLSVVAGLGNSIFAPVRFFCRPEVRLTTLLPRELLEATHS